MGSFTKWLSELFGAARAEEIEENGYRLEERDTPLQLERMAIQSAVSLISAAVGQCRFRTFLEGEEKQLEEYYLWNYSPNANQSSTQFLQDFVETLVYNNEALIVERRGELFLAESFSYQEEGSKELTFTNITIGSESISDKKAGNVLFFRLGNTDIRPLLSNLCHQYESLIQKAVNSYERGAADKGILNIDTLKRGKVEDEEQYRRDLMDGRFKKFFSSQNAVLPLYDGYTYTPHKRELRNTSELNDVKNMSDEIYNRVGQAFRIPPAFLRGETAQSGDGMDQFIRMCVRPICNMLEEEITRKRYGIKEFQKGSFVAVDMSLLEITGIFASADKLDKIIGCGILSIDEVRAKTGEAALNTPEAQKHFITKNYGEVETGEGEQNEE
ncbi:MAG: phage portal protein [Roseburia sp.]|nr:phage portal protein [Roseburia sp.]MCM1097796.1 phage portal protein [Ruminococcus flavefaciens]